MKRTENLLELRLADVLDEISRAIPETRTQAVDALLRTVVPALPAAARSTPIELVSWSQPYMVNQWWRKQWDRLGVRTVADLAKVGTELAETPGVGRTKLLVLAHDLLALASSARHAGRQATSREELIETIRQDLEAIEQGPPTPQPHRVQSLYRALVAALPAGVRHWKISGLPWSSEWCYTTRLWSNLGIVTVADIARVAHELGSIRGIGRGKVLTIARELIFLDPELSHQLRSVMSPSRRRSAGATPPARPEARSLVSAIDRLAEKLSQRDRDILRRRIGWRYSRRPEKLRTLAEHHGVTQERIRQLESQLRKRLIRLVQVQNVPALLRAALRGRTTPVPLENLLSCGEPALQGMMKVWQPLAGLLASVGGPYLFEEGHRVLVSSGPPSRRAPRLRSVPRRARAESSLSCTSPTSRTAC